MHAGDRNEMMEVTIWRLSDTLLFVDVPTGDGPFDSRRVFFSPNLQFTDEELTQRAIQEVYNVAKNPSGDNEPKTNKGLPG